MFNIKCSGSRIVCMQGICSESLPRVIYIYICVFTVSDKSENSLFHWWTPVSTQSAFSFNLNNTEVYMLAVYNRYKKIYKFFFAQTNYSSQQAHFSPIKRLKCSNDRWTELNWENGGRFVCQLCNNPTSSITVWSLSGQKPCISKCYILQHSVCTISQLMQDRVVLKLKHGTLQRWWRWFSSPSVSRLLSCQKEVVVTKGP